MSYINYGYIPSPKDDRDYNINMYTSYNIQENKLPKEFIIPKLPPIMNQGNSGMCNAFSIAKIQTVAEWLEHGECVPLSPASIYVHKIFKNQEGMCPRFALDSLKSNGLMILNEFNYVGRYQDCLQKYNQIDTDIKIQAKQRKCKSYVKLNSNIEIQKFINKSLLPVLVGINLYPSFYKCDKNKGIVRNVSSYEKKSGGHAMIIVGWKEINHKQYWIVQNHWGKDWGDNGYCYIPFDYKGIAETWGITDLKPNNMEIALFTNPQMCVVNNELMDNVRIKNIDNTIYLSLRDIGNIFNMDIEWNNEKKIAILKGKDL